jgi:hypothetical protein
LLKKNWQNVSFPSNSLAFSFKPWMTPWCSPFSRRDPCFKDGAEEDDDFTGAYIEWWVGVWVSGYAVGTDVVILCVLFLQVRVLYLKTTMGKPVRIYWFLITIAEGTCFVMCINMFELYGGIDDESI